MSRVKEAPNCSLAQGPQSHGSHLLKYILKHLESCEKCSAAKVLRSYHTRILTQRPYVDAVPNALVNFANKLARINPNDRHVAKYRVWFIQHARSWALKIHYSKHLTELETAEAVILQAKCEARIPSFANRSWPTSSYEKKHRSPSGKLIKRRLPDHEIRNDELFCACSNLDRNVILKYEKNPKGLLMLLEVMQVINA